MDSWYITPGRLALEFPDARIIKVLLFCPLDLAYRRFLKRNAEALSHGNLSEKSYLRQLIGSFISLYQISSDPSQPVQIITKMDLDSTFEVMAKSLSGNVRIKRQYLLLKRFQKAIFMK